MNFLKIITENPILIFLTNMFTILAIPLSIYLFYQSLGVKKFKYISKWYIFDKNNEQLPNGLHVPKNLLDMAPTYYAKPCQTIRTQWGGQIILPRSEDEPVSMYDRDDNICIAKFAFWNSGRYCLNAEDVVHEKPIQIHNPINKIISASVIEQEEITNHIKVDLIDEHTVNISFSYIDKREGAVIALAYTGKTASSIEHFTFTGKVKGGWKFKKISNSEDRNRVQRNYFHEVKISRSYNIILIIFILTIIVIFLLLTINSFLPLFNKGTFASILYFIPWSSACISILLSLISKVSIPHKIWNSFNTGQELL